MPVATAKNSRRWRVNLPLRWVLTLLFVVPTVGATALVGYLSYRSGQHATETLGHQLVNSANRQVMQEIQALVEKSVLANRLNGAAARQARLHSQSMSTLEMTLFERMQQFHQLSATGVVSPQGLFRLVERYPTLNLVAGDPSNPQQLLIYRLNSQGQRQQLISVNKNLDVRDRPFYQLATAQKKPGWGPIVPYGHALELSLNAFEPIYDRATGTLMGVSVTHLRLNQLNQFLRNLDISRAGQVIIMEQNGDIVATSTGDQALQPEPKSKKLVSPPSPAQRLNLFNSQNQLLRTVGQHLRDNAPGQSADGSGLLEVNHQGVRYYIKMMPFQGANGLNWYILTVVPKSYFLGAMQSTVETTIILSLGVLLGAIILGLVTYELLLKGFAQLDQASQHIARGHLHQRLPLDHPIAELNRMGETFNRMADQLQQSFDAIKNALVTSEAKFSTIFRTSPDPMMIATLEDGIVLAVNESHLTFFGYTADEVIGRPALEFNLWHNLDAGETVLSSLLEAGRVQNLEMPVCTRAGLVKTVLLSAEMQTLDNQSCVIVVSRDVTDRKQAELALQHSEARYRAIVEDQTELICRVLPDTTTLFVNDAYCRYFGVDRDAIIGRSFLPRVDTQDQAEIVDLFQRFSPAHAIVTVENRVIVQGEIHWMQWVNHALFDAQGTLTEIQAAGRDITELKQAEAALKASNERFQQLAETVEEGFFVFETTTAQYSYLNPAYFAISGIPVHLATQENAIRGMTHWFNNIHPDDRDRIKQALQAERQGQNFDEEYRFIRPDGDLRWLRSKAFPIQAETGAVIRIVGTVEDITNRKQLELALQDSEERFRRAFDDSPLGMSLVSVTGQFLRVNAQYCALLGYTEAELQTMTFQSLTHPDDLATDQDGVQQMLRGQMHELQLEKRYITKSGTILPVLMQMAPIRAQTGHILYFVGHIQDIGERLKVQRMKDEFISIVSHELRTPLTSIRGALGILESGIFNARPEKASHMLKIALSNSDRLVRLVNDILDLERLQSGKVKLVRQPCPVAELMQQACESVQTLADQAKIFLACEPLTATVCWVDPDAIVQTLTNLLSNAIKFSSAGETVWLKADKVEDGVYCTPQVRFSVCDRGRGIPSDKVEAIFEQFQQVDASDSRRKGGTGLGLAICKNIVQQHGGKIWVESVLGKGSTFYFILPLICE